MVPEIYEGVFCADLVTPYQEKQISISFSDSLPFSKALLASEFHLRTYLLCL